MSWRKVAAGVDHRFGRAVLHPGQDRVLLGPAEGGLHSPVVSRDDPLIAPDQRHKRHRLGGRHGHVRPGRCSISPSLPCLPRCGPPGTLPSRITWNVPGLTGPERPSPSAPLPAQALASRCAGRVEDWRASVRVRWLFRRFRSRPQSGSLGRVSSPRSSNRTCGFPASGFRTRSCLRPRKARSQSLKPSEAIVVV